ncbi:LytR/AlgR family response regulator transcription factor [Fusibacter ferrireducens]|uniref:Stage 0 sporulation protein A homolog n=1 Tax=Fusibacter ferrireducens TaxID=2785058 RepID=A0ABR9ZSB6_9FIRM|nr:LytTR family DNA-binding domain-containing protein [Fusibacter ferrireducens]MBF4693352.1 response regulator transcription factor [Fusibacter ferrireducens]
MIHILIVEDDAIIAKGLSDLIFSFDSRCKVKITGRADEAYKYICENKIDLILLDIQLEDASGYELAKQIRLLDRYLLVPIVFITAIPSRELLAFKEIHCYDYIIKPFQDEEVIKIIKPFISQGENVELNDRILHINQKQCTYVVRQSEILYIEKVNRYIEMVTVNEILKISGYTLKMLLDELTSVFVQCHKGYIVNKKQIAHLNYSANLIQLRHYSKSIPIGRKYKELFKGGFQ